MSKPDATGGQSLEEILASIRQSLGTAEPGATDSDEQPAPMAKETELVSAAPAEPAASDDDLSDLLDSPPMPLGTDVMSAGPDGAAPPAKGASQASDPLWFWPRRPAPAAPQDVNPPAEPAIAPEPQVKQEEIRLTRPETLRSSLPPLFGPEEPTIAVAGTANRAPPADLESPPTQPPPPALVAEEAGSSDKPTTNGTDAAIWSVEPIGSEPSASAAPESAAAVPEPERQAFTPFVAPTAAGPEAAKPLIRAVGAAPTVLPNGHAPSAEPGVPTEEAGASQAADEEGAAQARVLEQAIAQLLEPVLRKWLDANLPRMVEEVIRAEVAQAIKAERDSAKV